MARKDWATINTNWEVLNTCAMCGKKFHPHRGREHKSVLCSQRCSLARIKLLQKQARPEPRELIRQRCLIVPETGCWEWQGALNSKGYGSLSIDSKAWVVHRLAYSVFVGPVDNPALPCVCHKCDNRKCCNPDHLFLGTYKDNAQDCVRKGRANRNVAKGEASHLNKLTEDQVRQIYASPLSQYKTAKMFGIRQATVSKIKRRERWAHLDYGEDANV